MTENATDLYLEERRRAILQRVTADGRVSVADLSRDFGVSGVTIRADLQALAGRRLVVRTHGGAIPMPRSPYELSLAARLQQQVVEKERIGAAAARLVQDGEAIFLDSSSTALAVARCLKDRHYLTVITNGLTITQELIDAAGVTVVLLGGTLRRETASVVGESNREMLRKFNIQKGFFGAHGITAAEGLTDVSFEEAELKRGLITICRQAIAVVDATKWGRAGIMSFADLAQVHTIITDARVPAPLLEAVQRAGPQVILA